MKIKRSNLPESAFYKQNHVVGMVFEFHSVNSENKNIYYFRKIFLIKLLRTGKIIQTRHIGSYSKHDLSTGNFHTSFSDEMNFILFNQKTPLYKKRIFFEVED